MDWTVGEILDALDRAGIKDETFVYFSSDNGGHNEETGIDGDRQGGWNGIYRGLLTARNDFVTAWQPIYVLNCQRSTYTVLC